MLPYRFVVEGANLYYATMHLTTMGIFLVWLFLRHRDRYRPVRTTLALTTLGCLLVQFVPVAPPRMLPGFVDTGTRYGQSVYSNGLPIDQLSAMPSVHVAWAALVGYFVWQCSPSRWRFIGPLHFVLTVLVVVVTGNHWWLDGIVAVAILRRGGVARHRPAVRGCGCPEPRPRRANRPGRCPGARASGSRGRRAAGLSTPTHALPRGAIEDRVMPEKPRSEHTRPRTLLGLLGVGLAVTIVCAGLYVVGMFVVLAVGMSHYGSNK